MEDSSFEIIVFSLLLLLFSIALVHIGRDINKDVPPLPTNTDTPLNKWRRIY